MHHTFEAYLIDDDGHRRFEAITCPRQEIMRRAEELLRERGHREIEVCQQGERLFSLFR